MAILLQRVIDELEEVGFQRLGEVELEQEGFNIFERMRGKEIDDHNYFGRFNKKTPLTAYQEHVAIGCELAQHAKWDRYYREHYAHHQFDVIVRRRMRIILIAVFCWFNFVCQC